MTDRLDDFLILTEDNIDKAYDVVLEKIDNIIVEIKDLFYEGSINRSTLSTQINECKKALKKLHDSDGQSYSEKAKALEDLFTEHDMPDVFFEPKYFDDFLKISLVESYKEILKEEIGRDLKAGQRIDHYPWTTEHFNINLYPVNNRDAWNAEITDRDQEVVYSEDFPSEEEAKHWARMAKDYLERRRLKSNDDINKKTKRTSNLSSTMQKNKAKWH